MSLTTEMIVKNKGETASVKTTSLLAKWEKKPGLTAFRCSALPIQQSHFPLTMSQLCLHRWVFSFLHCTACKEVMGFQMFKNRNQTPKCFHSLPQYSNLNKQQSGLFILQLFGFLPFTFQVGNLSPAGLVIANCFFIFHLCSSLDVTSV